MNSKILVLLGLILVISAKHLGCRGCENRDDDDRSHQSLYNSESYYPSHYCDRNRDSSHYCGSYGNRNRDSDHYCGSYGNRNRDSDHYCQNDENRHQATASQDLFQALKGDPTISQILKNPNANEADFEKVKDHIISTLKSNPQLQSKLADQMFGNGNIGALFSNQQRVKLLNYVMDHPEIITTGKSNAKSQVINFIKNDPELSSIYSSNNALFGN